MEKVLVVSVHPDDETIGCGGTILKHKLSGDKIYWLILTNVDTLNGWKNEIVVNRQKEIENVASSYGFDKIFKLDFPTTKLDQIPRNLQIEKISKVINDVKPSIVYLVNRSDVHTDHQIGFQSVYSCTKNFRYPFIKRILMYECLSETEFSPSTSENAFIPNVYVDITDFFQKKIEIIKIYNSEVMKDFYPRSLNNIEALAKIRGSRIGKKYAEAFVLLLDIL